MNSPDLKSSEKSDKFKPKVRSKAEVIALSHYARKDVQRELFEFCKQRETIGNFNNKFFAKRPDCFDYPSDIPNAAKQGVTSFHCSQELWSNPLDIDTDMTPEQYDQLRTGWDFLIDIDSPYLDYSKIAAKLLLKALASHGVKNVGIKFSGSKGFHLIVPFKAFPQFLDDQKTSEMFPSWPRMIAGYLQELIQHDLTDAIVALDGKEKLQEKGQLTSQHTCPRCGKIAVEKTVSLYKCPNFKCRSEVTNMKSTKKTLRCSSCNGDMNKVSQENIIFCESCKLNTAAMKNQGSTIGGQRRESSTPVFEEQVMAQAAQDAVDLVLVAPRHLFRAPYSLHEKTSFASIVLNADQLDDFKPSDADPLKITQVKSFMPQAIEGEARELLLQAIDWGAKNEVQTTKKYDSQSKVDISGLTFSQDMFPPVIKTILKGIKSDGRKRALSLLLSFLTSLEFPQDFVEEKIADWNKKNHHPLKDGYVKSQIVWHLKNKRLPPNYDKPVYKLFGNLAASEQKIKNPINYTITLAMKQKAKAKHKKS